MYHLTTSVVLILNLLSISITAAPTQDHGVSVKVFRHAVGSRPQVGVMVLYKAYRKRNWTLPEGFNAAVAFHEDVVANPVHSTIKEDVAVEGSGTNSGTVTAKAYGTDTEYLCPVQIGEHKYNMDLDTGSADFWVFNTALPAADQTGHDAIYNPSQSKSFHSIAGASFDVSYGDNSSTSGLVGQETVRIGTITVVGQAVECTYLIRPYSF